MVEVEELKERFSVKPCPPWGTCIIVPGSEFHQSWERELYDKGLSCVRTDFGDIHRPVVLVRLDPEGSEETTQEREAEAAAEATKPYIRGRWSKVDQKRLVKLMNAAEGSLEEKAKAVLNEFPGRPLDSLMRQYSLFVTSSVAVKDTSSVTDEVRETISENTEKSGSQIKETQEKIGLRRVLKGKDTPLGPRWTEDSYRLLIELWLKGKKIREIAAEFPDRSGHAVGAALARLKNSGVIKPRWTQKKDRFEKKQAVGTPQEPQEHPSESKPNLVCNLSIHIEAKSASSIKAVLVLLKALRELK